MFDSLTYYQRKIIIEESDKTRLLMRDLVRKQEQDQIADMKSKGIRIDTPDLAPFQAKMGPAYEKIRRNIGEENFDKWMEMARATAK